MKRIFAIIAAMSALLSLTACGGKNSPQQSSTPENSAVSTPESTPANDPESTATSDSESDPESEPENAPTNDPESVPESEPEGDPESEPENAPANDPESVPESSGDSTAADETDSTVTSKVESSATSEPVSSSAENAALPLSEYPVGSYFTNDGKPCTDHGECNWDKPCNCVNFDNSIQSVGFAKYAYFKVMGKHVSVDEKVVIDADISEQTARDTLKGLPCGAYVTVTTGNDMFHAMAVVSADDNGITVYQANYGGGCVVSSPTYTWKEFARLFPHIEYYVK